MNNSEKAKHLRDLLRIELCKREFWQFCLFYDHDFFSSRSFLKEVADAFQKIEQREIRSLSVSMPPRAGKSYITSLFCAWTLGRNPSKSVMRNTCTATLYLKFSYDVRSIVKSEKFQKVFASVKLSDDKSNLQGWNTNSSSQVGYFGAGVGGTIIGFGASNIGITDDLYRNMEDAMSDTVNDRVISWKEATHDSRFESGCARIDIGTRWTINDMLGRNMENKVYDESIVIKALDENDRSFCESVMTTDEYLAKRHKTPKEIWLAEYQQQPVDLQGRLFSKLEVIEPSELEEILKPNRTQQNPLGYDGAIAYVDVADQGADYTACPIAIVVKDRFFVVDYVFTRDNTDISIPLIADKLNQWRVTYCRVESNSLGAIFGRQLQTMTKAQILPVANTQNKMTRIIMQSAFIQNTLTFVRKPDPMSEQFLQNVYTFAKEGKNKHDDAPDSLAGLSMFLRSLFEKFA